MSLLSPKELIISLAPGACLIDADRQSSDHQFAIAGGDAIAASLQFLDTHISELAKKHRSVSLRLSDSFGVIQVLPWQEKLSKQTEIDRYGRICLEEAGSTNYTNYTNYEGWSLHADFLRYGENGIVYGFPNQLITTLQDLCRAHSLTLKRLIPKSAHAFFHAKPPRGKRAWYDCCIEPHRISVMVYARSHLLSMHVEPVVTSRQASLIRIFTRLGIHHEAPQLLRVDGVSEDGLKEFTDTALMQFPGVEVQATKKRERRGVKHV